METTWPQITAKLHVSQEHRDALKRMEEKPSRPSLTAGKLFEKKKADKKIKPYFTTKPRKCYIEEGNTAKFQCAFAGEPTPELVWEWEGTKISPGGRYQIYQTEKFSYLEITDITAGDEGTIMSNASNAAGQAQASAPLTVKALPKPKLKKPTAPKFLAQLEDPFEVAEGEGAIWECEVIGLPEPVISWYREGKILPLSSDYRQNYDGKRAWLEMDEIFPEDEGMIACVAKNDLGESRSECRLKVKVAEGSEKMPPTFIKQLKGMMVADGDKLVMECSMTGNPEPSIKWLKGKEELKSTSDFQLSFDGTIARLEVAEVFTEDDGQYTCIATNPVGEAKTSARVTVTEAPKAQPPKFTKELEDTVVDDGDKVEMAVKLQGTPPIDVFWVRQNKELPPNDPVCMQTHVAGSLYKLAILKASTEDTGFYACEVVNDFGQAFSECKLIVRPKDTEGLLPPEFVEKPKSIQIEEGLSSRLTCEVKGEPAPMVRWTKDGKDLTGGSNSRFKITSDGNVHTFEITTTLATDAGRYGCVAENSVGQAKCQCSMKVEEISDEEHTHKDFRALLKSRPSLQEKLSQDSEDSEEREVEQHDFREVLKSHIEPQLKKKPGFVTHLVDQVAKEGSEVVFVVEIEGVPEPTIEWKCNKKTIKESKFFKMSYKDNKAKLVIAEAYPEDEGIYTCTATNSSGTATENCDLVCKEGSGAASTKKAKEGAGPATAPVFEDPPKNISILKGKKAVLKAVFNTESMPEIKWMRNGEKIVPSNRIKIDNIRDKTTLTIRECEQSDIAKYTVKLENDAGVVTASASINVEDIPEPPFGKPTCSKIAKSSLVLTWSGPTYDGGCPVNNYKVEMTLSEKFKDNWKVLTSNCRSTSYQVKDLEANKTYKFRVMAENKHGFSKPSAESDTVIVGDRKESAATVDEDDGDDDQVFESSAVELKKANVDDFYEKKDLLGKGRFGQVFEVVEKATGNSFAAKYMRYRATDRAEKLEEINIMKELSHPKLLQLYDAYDHARNLIIITEIIRGGELFERIAADDFELTEQDAIYFVRQICTGMQFMHEKNILHLDLKPENVLCIKPRSNLIKIIDFGLARHYDPKKELRVMFGTPEFVAPEVINYDQIGTATDVWSIGVICYILLSGLSPFAGESDTETLANVTKAAWDFDDEAFDAISKDAKDFIEKLLIKKKEKRMTVQECLAHKWLAQSKDKQKKQKLNKSKLKQFLARRKWQVEAEQKKFAEEARAQEEKVGSDKPVFITKMKDNELFEGDTAFFEVQISGTPAPKVVWFKKNKEVVKDKRTIIEEGKDGNYTLMIENVTAKDESVYKCVATNEAGAMSCRAGLFIENAGK